MVTANLNHERRPPSAIDDDDETNDRHIQTRLDRLYLENPSYNRTGSHQQYSYSQRTLSPTSSRDMFVSANTVPVYRHGRKFYVSIEEYERMRAEERRHRRNALLKNNNLPISKSHSIHSRGPSTFLYNPIHRSTSQPQEHRFGVLRTPHLPANSTVINNNNLNRFDTTRQSRPIYRYSDDRDDLSSMTSATPFRLPTTTAIRSNSSDKVLDLRKTPQTSISSQNTYAPDDYELKRSISAESMQIPVVQQPQTLLRRTVPPPTITITTKPNSDFSMSTATTVSPPPPPPYSVTSTDQTYSQSNASKLNSYFNKIPSSSLHSPNIPKTSSYDSNIQKSEPVYAVINSTTRRPNTNSTALLTRTSTHNSNSNEYYFRDTTSGSFSDENSSSPSVIITRQNPDNYRSRRTQLVVETDEEYAQQPPPPQQQQGDVWLRQTARSQSSDGFTEKKRVRFADMEGYTLETVPDVEPQRSPVNNRLLIKRSYGQPTSHYQEPVQQSYHSSYYPTTTRGVGGNGSKLATDV